MTKTDPRRPTAELVLEAARARVPARKIAAHLGISRQRVYQHIALLRAIGHLPPHAYRRLPPAPQ